MTGAVVSTTTSSIGAGTVLPPINPQLVNQLVGYLEYSQSLRNFDRLLNISTGSELDLFDEIVQSRDEFVIYTNLSRQFEKTPSKLTEAPLRAGDDFQRRGLPWIMALARLELGAMAAGFTEMPEPFGMYRPTPYEMDEYNEILFDSTRTHYWSLWNDPMLSTLRARTTPEQQAIAYSRRVAVALEFLRASRDRLSNQLTVSQRNELDVWHHQLSDLRNYLLYTVLGLHSPSGTMSRETNVRLQACPRLAEIAREEMSSGKATISNAPPELTQFLGNGPPSSGTSGPPPGVGGAGAPAAGIVPNAPTAPPVPPTGTPAPPAARPSVKR